MNAGSITTERVPSARLKPKPQQDQLGFGKFYTDHMFMMDYEAGSGWHNPRITPYQPITLDPAAKIFHYGQTVFEGLKAYRTKDGRILLFRPELNMRRLNISSERISIPPIDEALALEALKQLIQVDRDWVPSVEGTSLYIRPFIISTEPALGIAASTQYTFMIIMSPVASIYTEGVHPVSIYVENQYVRAVPGGTGTAKTAGNYASSLKAQNEATAKGYSQVLWLDGVEKKYVEEVGNMNVFFKVNGQVITPALNGSILHGVTRNSMLELLRSWGIPVEERAITIEEIFQASADGWLEEAFGTGTAAVISPIGKLGWEDRTAIIHGGHIGELTQKLYDTLTGIQKGIVADPFGWTVEV